MQRPEDELGGAMGCWLVTVELLAAGPGVLAGVNLATLGGLFVANAHGPTIKRPQKALYDRRATLLFLPGDLGVRRLSPGWLSANGIVK